MKKLNNELMLESRVSLRGDWGKGVLITFISFVLMMPISSRLEDRVSSYVSGEILASIISSLVGGVYALLITVPLTLGAAIFYLNLSRNTNPRVAQLFHGYKRFSVVVALGFLLALFVALWTILLIVPGIIAGLSYALSYYILVDNPNMTALESITLSKKMMDGHKKKLFFLHVRFLPWTLLAILTVGIGFLWLAPYYNTTIAKFYDAVRADYTKENTETKQVA